ncbi:MAG: HEAT repeat domain-containing protein [Chloroflexi bacterium]|uniref:HEAT repeat domain-containing protein n=1 Tax=Candidatus Chlorohelix allophototropha TaxID=3003348 RepID=A0A8T7M291_9CHLR|nr:HEAT repeat domain-containing protein [Chloroflexota bacterium]WJW67911.1 HEAT repeat domain-containing protein [Chloroflexota bacterium L227-S17]
MKNNSQGQNIYLNGADSMLYAPQARKINVRGNLFHAHTVGDSTSYPQTSSINHLIDSLRHEDWGVRQNSAKKLGELANKHALEPLIKTLRDDKDSFVRYRAAEALGKIANKRAVDVLINALYDPDLFVRRTAIEALSIIKDSRAIKPLLCKISGDEECSVCESAAEALAKIGDPRTLPGLEQIINSDIDEGRRALAIHTFEVIKARR